MLVLTRKKSEQILIPDLGIEVQVLRVSGNTVSLGFKAPRTVRIVRSEVCDTHAEEVESNRLVPASSLNAE